MTYRRTWQLYDRPDPERRVGENCFKVRTINSDGQVSVLSDPYKTNIFTNEIQQINGFIRLGELNRRLKIKG